MLFISSVVCSYIVMSFLARFLCSFLINGPLNHLEFSVVSIFLRLVASSAGFKFLWIHRHSVGSLFSSISPTLNPTNCLYFLLSDWSQLITVWESVKKNRSLNIIVCPISIAFTNLVYFCDRDGFYWSYLRFSSN